MINSNLSSLRSIGPISLRPILLSPKDVSLNIPRLIQGKNECGPTSLAMIMKYFGINISNYHNLFGSDTVGHGPLALKQKAEASGLTVRQENNGTLEDLAKLIDAGIPPLVLGIYGGGSNSTFSSYIDNASKAHWMVVTGYKRDASGKITHIYFNNPNQSGTQCWTASDFLNKFWNNNIIPGGHRYYIAMAKRGTPQETALKKYLPQDKIPPTFDSTLQIIDSLEDAFYQAEKISSEVAGWFHGLFA
jgi:ABC-type bacteriocin/lantibiotic exporter with double-glycine peptidase domain